MKYKHDLKANLTLSRAQRNIVLERALKKAPLQQQAPQMPLGGLAQGLTNNRAGATMPMQMPIASAKPPSDIFPAPEPEPEPMPSAINPEGELSDVEEMVQFSLIADQLWKDGGGNSSVGAKVWGELQKKSNTKHLDTPRDYFISNFIKYKNDPAKLKKKSPNEYRLLGQLDAEFNASQQGG